MHLKDHFDWTIRKGPLLYILYTIIFIWWISLVRHLLTEKFLQLFFYVSYQPFIIDHYSYPVIVYALLQIFQRKMSGRPNWAPIPSEIQGCNIEEKNEFKPPQFYRLYFRWPSFEILVDLKTEACIFPKINLPSFSIV